MGKDVRGFGIVSQSETLQMQGGLKEHNHHSVLFQRGCVQGIGYVSIGVQPRRVLLIPIARIAAA